MMEFTAANPVVEGEADGQRFAITSVVDVRARTCDTRIEVTRDSDGDAFTERHRQYFFTEGQIREALPPPASRCSRSPTSTRMNRWTGRPYVRPGLHGVALRHHRESRSGVTSPGPYRDWPHRSPEKVFQND